MHGSEISETQWWPMIFFLHHNLCVTAFTFQVSSWCTIVSSLILCTHSFPKLINMPPMNHLFIMYCASLSVCILNFHQHFIIHLDVFLFYNVNMLQIVNLRGQAWCLWKILNNDLSFLCSKLSLPATFNQRTQVLRRDMSVTRKCISCLTFPLNVYTWFATLHVMDSWFLSLCVHWSPLEVVGWRNEGEYCQNYTSCPCFQIGHVFCLCSSWEWIYFVK